MSVLIKGMEMPKSCIFCELYDADYYWCRAAKKEYHETIENKAHPDWCPLVSVPPHGRLIDENWLKDAMITTLEALKKNPKMDGKEMHLIAAFDTLRVMLEDAPTIIEAEVER